ncbi:carbon-nitrogen hydrolase family protein [Ferroacidibacillus organovorans]|uniref:CN hydrolase domain-containing protein n=1 Tax=Ferroacidibacillus organovorans TaxID=1765683 RepID=A0A101XTK6_9BACL|nr:carbon-nitrogen hydrolase family protein [Ferroacidibacillus organovorans]KUO97307.1 hypothetical protein ATW55_04485 [Ferroacidibacillus organovorans]
MKNNDDRSTERTMRLGLVQDAPIFGDVAQTLKQMNTYIKQAGMRNEKVDLLVFPELYVTGYYAKGWPCRPTPDDELEWINQIHALAQSEQLWIIFGHPYGSWHQIYTAARGLENRAFAATVNRIGEEYGDEFCGGSCVFHPNGTCLVEADDRPGLKTCDLRLSDLHDLDETLNYFRFRRPELYQL